MKFSQMCEKKVMVIYAFFFKYEYEIKWQISPFFINFDVSLPIVMRHLVHVLLFYTNSAHKTFAKNSSPSWFDMLKE